jgi:hypothetical protein
LTKEIAKAMNVSQYIAILITENYNKTVWTKTEYKKALSRQRKEGRTVMLPLIVGKAQIPDFIEDKLHIDLRQDFFSGIIKLVGLVHDLTLRRVSTALSGRKPESVRDVWRLLQSINFEPYVVLGGDDFDEMLKHGGGRKRGDYARFSPRKLLQSPAVSDHVKTLVRELL